MYTANIEETNAECRRVHDLIETWRNASTRKDRMDAADQITMILVNLPNFSREHAIGMAQALLFDFATINRLGY